MTLEEKILEILSQDNNLMAKEIVSKLKNKYKLKVDKPAVNKILYAIKSKGTIENNDNHQWSLINKSNKELLTYSKIQHKDIKRKQQPKQILEVKKNTINDPKNKPLAQLASYYVECLLKDMDAGLWCYARSKYGLPDYGQISVIPQSKGKPSSDVYDTPSINNVINKVRKPENKLILLFGYPISC